MTFLQRYSLIGFFVNSFVWGVSFVAVEFSWFSSVFTLLSKHLLIPLLFFGIMSFAFFANFSQKEPQTDAMFISSLLGIVIFFIVWYFLLTT